MHLRTILASFLSGRRVFRQKRLSCLTVRRSRGLQFEALESRYAPATFATIDSFSGATLGDVTTNSGGTGFAGNIVVSNTIDLDQGVDEDLQTTPEVGSGDATQLADTRTVDLDYTSVLAGTVAVTTNSGFIDFNSAANASANMEISYTLPIDVVLSDDTITFDISGFNASTGGLPTPFTLALNGTDVDTQLVGGNGTFTFDETSVAAFVGQQITSISLRMTGGLGNDLDILDFAGTFSTVDAQIDLEPLEATNEVGQEHTVTAIVQQDDGLPAGAPGDDADGFGPAPDGTEVLFVITNNGTDAALDDTADENNDGIFDNDEIVTTVNGEASITFTSTTTGNVDIHASTTFSIGGIEVTRETDGLGENSGDANKVFVDAQIDLDPLTATNPVNEQHTVTATVQQDDGLATGGDGVDGFADAPDGTEVLFVITNNGTDAALDDTADENNDGIFDNDEIVTTVGGEASITFVSTTAGTVDIHATTTFDVSGISLTRSTGAAAGSAENPSGLNSDDAEKIYEGVPVEEEEIRMTGGGSIFIPNADANAKTNGAKKTTDLRITHGFQLHCADLFPNDPNSVGDRNDPVSPGDVNNRLEINWDNGTNHVHFHLSYLNSVDCPNDPSIDPAPPPFTEGGPDTLIGVGTGLFSGKVGDTTYKKAAATVEFTFTDAGEPGVNDTAKYVIKVGGVVVGGVVVGGTEVLNSGDAKKLTFGNHQVHPELKNLSPAAALIQKQIDQTFARLDNDNLPEKQALILTSELLSQFVQLEASTTTSSATTGGSTALAQVTVPSNQGTSKAGEALTALAGRLPSKALDRVFEIWQDLGFIV